MMRIVVAILAGLAGAAVGSFVFDWLLGHGLYAMILPGALVGAGVGYGYGRYNLVLGIIAGLASLALGVFLEWFHLPFVADESLSFFLQNLAQVDPAHLIMILAGGFAGFWFGQGRADSVSSAKSTA